MTYGLLARFDTPHALVSAARGAREQGYRRLDAYSPFPIPALGEALALGRNRVPLIVLLGGIIGGAGAFFMQWYSDVIDYPIDVGGRPLDSWVSFIPITFELTILIAGLGALIGLLALNGLPKPYHPVFNVPDFARASKDGFFLAVEAADPRFQPRETRSLLERLGAVQIYDVEE